ncbi:hypothetical protein [Caulobacter sp. Root342]|nr:hypothetical protein [Caulobacter sp. Root342]
MSRRAFSYGEEAWRYLVSASATAPGSAITVTMMIRAWNTSP